MEHMDKLRELIRTEIENTLDEISTSAGAGAYLTPRAFVGDKRDNTDHMRQLAKRIGYTLTARGEKDNKGDKLQEKFQSMLMVTKKLNENYYQYRNDTSRLPHQKIGSAIAEINKQLKLVERALKMNHRLKKEYGVSNERLWKRTNHQMVKLEAKLVELAARLREMRG